MIGEHFHHLGVSGFSASQGDDEFVVKHGIFTVKWYLPLTSVANAAFEVLICLLAQSQVLIIYHVEPSALLTV